MDGSNVGAAVEERYVEVSEMDQVDIELVELVEKSGLFAPRVVAAVDGDYLAGAWQGGIELLEAPAIAGADENSVAVTRGSSGEMLDEIRGVTADARPREGSGIDGYFHRRVCMVTKF